MKKIVLILFILFLSGCYNYKELNKIEDYLKKNK